MADQPVTHWVAPPDRVTPRPHIAVVLALCVPLGVSGFVIWFGLIVAALGSWHLLAIGVLAAISQWAMSDRIWDRAASMTRGRLLALRGAYMVASAILYVAGAQLFPVPLLVD